MHTHHHDHIEKLSKNLIIAILLNAVIVIGEIAGGIIGNSLALLSDALHNLGDLLALILSLVASKMALKKANSKSSFGYIRSEIIVSFINSSALLLIGVYIIVEGFIRIQEPQEVHGTLLIIVAGISFFANAYSSYLLHSQSKKDLNAKSSYLHLMYDAVHSLAIVIIGILILFFNWTILDALTSIIIGVLMIKSSWSVITESANILNEGTPKEIDHDEVQKYLESFPEIKGIHHLHIWKLSSTFIALSVHITVQDQLVSQAYLIIDKIEKALEEKYGINHPTVQLEAEFVNCNGKPLKIEFDNGD
jgi:cobalt-zinc-cadmium efflux system protein